MVRRNGHTDRQTEPHRIQLCDPGKQITTLTAFVFKVELSQQC